MVSEIDGTSFVPKFDLGRLAVTSGVAQRIQSHEIMDALRRHSSGDWGSVGKGDWNANDRALVDGSRLFSVYHSASKEKFWVITEWDRSVTTVLLPSEY